jgi:hypothetical protein
MSSSQSPIACALPENVINCVRSDNLDGLLISPLTSLNANSDELRRLLGPLWEFDDLENNQNFERWLARPSGCQRVVLLWFFKKKRPRYRFPLQAGESLALISGAYLKRDYDHADAVATRETAKVLISFGGREVRSRSWVAEITEWLIQAVHPYKGEDP